MGRGSSGLKGSSKGGGTQANTPAGISYDDFLKLPETQRFQMIDNIIANPNIVVPSYLDGSDTTKVIYALGMDNKPTVVSDAQLDALPGREIFRTVYESGSMPPPSSGDIMDQIKTGDYTQLSGSGGSAHGRALYFATNFSDSADYGDKKYGWNVKKNVMITRGKINPNAKIATESNLVNQMNTKGYNPRTSSRADRIALYAISQGIDGWASGTYTMIVNRGATTMSSLNKRISKRNTTGPTSRTVSSWAQAAPAR